MPFTLSHAAAALPFRRTRLDMPALVTGCFAPDFPYFMFISPHGFIGHTLPGIFIFDLPLSLVALWLFHAYMKQPLLMLLPEGVRSRLEPGENRYTFLPATRLAMIVVSIVIGSATHILWDSFTHSFYWPYRHWSFLREMVHVPVLGEMGMYKVLQYASTVFGIAVLAVWVWLWYRATRPVGSATEPYTHAQIRVITLVTPVIAVCGGIVRAFVERGVPSMSIRSVMYFALDSGIAATSLLALGLLICGAFLRRRVAVKAPV